MSLELLTDIEMLDMFEEGIRGGISSIMDRHGKANNKYMGKDFNPENSSKCLVYLDADNLYGWAMTEPLPTKGFKWMTEEELQDWEKVFRLAKVKVVFLRLTWSILKNSMTCITSIHLLQKD